MSPEKLCFAGRVGKTSLVLRYVENVFSDKQVATVQASYLTKRLTVDGQSVTLSIWVQFHTNPPMHSCFLLPVVDTDDRMVLGEAFPFTISSV
jgi:hypothetical protein